MKLQHLRAFLAVYEHRSFTVAAERVHATQSGVSMQIKELEEDLGVSLFERSARGVQRTAAGECFYAHALALLGRIDAARQDVGMLTGQTTGSISVGLMPTFARAALAPTVREFTAIHPSVKLRIVEGYSAVLTESVAREELDFAVVPPAAPDSRIVARHLARDREMFVTSMHSSRGHLLPIALAEAGPLKIILPAAGNVRRARLDQYLMMVGAKLQDVIEMDAMMSTLELVAASDWVAIVPATLCHPDIAAGPRKVHPLEKPSLEVDYVLITPAVRSVSPPAIAFAEIFAQQLRRIAEDWDRTLHQKN